VRAAIGSSFVDERTPPQGEPLQDRALIPAPQECVLPQWTISGRLELCSAGERTAKRCLFPMERAVIGAASIPEACAYLSA
jgi:hypothetical protein